MSLDCRKKSEHPEKTHTDTGKTNKGYITGLSSAAKLQLPGVYSNYSNKRCWKSWSCHQVCCGFVTVVSKPSRGTPQTQDQASQGRSWPKWATGSRTDLTTGCSWSWVWQLRLVPGRHCCHPHQRPSTSLELEPGLVRHPWVKPARMQPASASVPKARVRATGARQGPAPIPAPLLHWTTAGPTTWGWRAG